jgi:uncharacterized membrane protein (DUF485 family)
MLHEPAPKETGPDPAFAYKRRLGVLMFSIYALVYAAFIAINVIVPKSMETIVLAGLNLAVVYGFGLILLALGMALLYSSLCGRKEKALLAQGGK